MTLNKMTLNHCRSLVVLKKYLPPIKYNFVIRNIKKDNEKKIINIKYEEKFCPIWISKNF